MRTFPDFENELKAIDSRLSIVPNRNIPQLANIKLLGRDICPIPSEEILDNDDAGYRITLPNGMEAPHRSRTAAISIVKSTLGKIENDKDFHDAFFGVGEYK